MSSGIGFQRRQRRIKELVDKINEQALLIVEMAECRAMLDLTLDRDKDPNDSLRDLVAVACDGLHERDEEITQLKEEIERLSKSLNDAEMEL